MQTIFVLANGELTAADAARARTAMPGLIVAADGGWRHARALGWQPAVVIGDFDSTPPSELAALAAAGARLARYPADKDETDLELALLFAAAQHPEHVVVLGGLGGRLDMALANLLLLAHPRLASLRVEFWAGAQTAWLISPPGQTIAGAPGDTLSLLPLGGAALDITSSGLRYPLRGEALPFGPARGVSNVFTERQAVVNLRAGALLAVQTPGRA